MYNATVYIYTDYDSKSASNEISPSNNINVLCVKAICLKSYLKLFSTKTKGGLQNILGWTNKIFPWGTCPHSHPPLMTHAGIPCKRSSCLGNAVAVEMLITGVLVLVVFASAADPVNSIQVKGSAPLAIG